MRLRRHKRLYLVIGWYEIKSWWWMIEYAVRPYDMLADRRRWFWQPATRCERFR